MQKNPSSWIIPSLFIAYLSLATYREVSGVWQALGILAALASIFILRSFERISSEDRPLKASRIIVIGAVLYVLALLGPSQSQFYRLLRCLGLALATIAPLRALIDLPERSSILPLRKQARSADAQFIASTLWGFICAALFLRAAFPSFNFIDSQDLQLSILFGTIGSLLILFFALFRASALRRYELGAAERIKAGLLLVCSALIVTLLGGLSGQFVPQSLMGPSLLICGLLSTYFLEQERTDRLEQHLRSAVVLLFVLVPIAICYVVALFFLPSARLYLALLALPLFFFIGSFYSPLSKLLASQHARWELGLKGALDALSGVANEEALRSALVKIASMQSSNEGYPSLWIAEKEQQYKLNRAEYLQLEAQAFPRTLATYCQAEPFGVLRQECLKEALVRKPELKSVNAWFEAHDVQSVIALRDSEKILIGLLVLPLVQKPIALTLSQIMQFEELGQRFGALLEMHLRFQDLTMRVVAAENKADLQSEEKTPEKIPLISRLQNEKLSHTLTRSSFSPLARMTIESIIQHDPAQCLHLEVEPGIALEAWAGRAMLEHAHDKSLFCLDLSAHGGLEKLQRLTERPWSDSHAFAFLYPPFESEELLARCIEDLLSHRRFVILVTQRCDFSQTAEGKKLSALVKQGSSITLPSLCERPEDLKSMVIAELADLSRFNQTGQLAISPDALMRLLDHPFPGNEAELKSLLLLASQRADDGYLTLELAHQLLGEASSPEPKTQRHALDNEELYNLKSNKRTRGRIPPRRR